MKALSLWQPWASAVAIGLKSIETRHWWTGVRGPIAIHAAKRWTGEEREFAADFAGRFDERLRNPPLGAIIATATLTACSKSEQLIGKISATEEAFGNYGPRRFGFVLTDVVALAEPIPFRGMQGFFDVPDELFGLAPEPALQRALFA